MAVEVRNLAQRSASAAKETSALIHDSSRKVETGAGLVAKSGQTLGDLVDSMKKITALVSEIAAASEEQATGIDQVNRAVTQMDQIVQANAAETEELSSAAHTMTIQAQDLLALVGRFKLGGEDGAPTAHARTQVPPAAAASSRPGSFRPRRDADTAVMVGGGARSGSAS